ncbi:winged helix-turn-helix transcriptional regulator [Nonomuraea endophytica]|uniref:DNA-binding HxlR family transcriptional regulator n=1 Tax=Nonomuraea endophytica TaxID=714136 RepID=A0A7W7ZYM3_9ACTN|nr:helix-turn-helix domain-containing protein [Nonomuraea endophytica]MBB5075859.1 DNA-binding HxlR family transcriptional regulator [Nonomuraea endophytica]
MKKSRYTCGLDAAMDIMGGKWKVLILWGLCDGPRRFGEVRREVPGISERILTLQLREMEKAGLVLREDYHQIPPKVVYSLTEFGSSLLAALIPLGDWGAEHMARIEAIPRD